MSTLTTPAQQEAPGAGATAAEGEVPASIHEKDKEIMAQPTDNVTTAADPDRTSALWEVAA